MHSNRVVSTTVLVWTAPTSTISSAQADTKYVYASFSCLGRLGSYCSAQVKEEEENTVLFLYLALATFIYILYKILIERINQQN